MFKNNLKAYLLHLLECLGMILAITLCYMNHRKQ